MKQFDKHGMNSLKVVYLPVNQAYGVFWFGQQLRIFSEAWEVQAYLDDLTYSQ